MRSMVSRVLWAGIGGLAMYPILMLSSMAEGVGVAVMVMLEERRDRRKVWGGGGITHLHVISHSLQSIECQEEKECSTLHRACTQ